MICAFLTVLRVDFRGAFVAVDFFVVVFFAAGFFVTALEVEVFLVGAFFLAGALAGFGESEPASAFLVARGLAGDLRALVAGLAADFAGEEDSSDTVSDFFGILSDVDCRHQAGVAN